jgi:hypothetical protein
MDVSDPAVAPPPLGGPFRLHPFRARGRVDVGTPTLLVHEWTEAGYSVRGLVGLLDLTGGVARAQQAVVLPHERVHADQVDQLAQRMARGRVDPAPILLAHRGLSSLRTLLDEVCSEPPRVVRSLRDQRQRVWVVTRPSELDLVAEQLRGTSALLADGHHRYAAHHALRAIGTPGADRALSVLVDHDDTPLHLGAVHRVLTGPVVAAARELGWAVSPWTPANPVLSVTPGRVVMTDGTGARTLTLPPTPGPPGTAVATTATMPVLALDRLLRQLETPGTTYHHEAEQAIEEARRRGATALLLPSPTLEEVMTVVRQGRLLPEKATSFQPKPRPGLVTRRLRDA